MNNKNWKKTWKLRFKNPLKDFDCKRIPAGEIILEELNFNYRPSSGNAVPYSNCNSLKCKCNKEKQYNRYNPTTYLMQ